MHSLFFICKDYSTYSINQLGNAYMHGILEKIHIEMFPTSRINGAFFLVCIT